MDSLKAVGDVLEGVRGNTVTKEDFDVLKENLQEYKEVSVHPHLHVTVQGDAFAHER